MLIREGEKEGCREGGGVPMLRGSGGTPPSMVSGGGLVRVRRSRRRRGDCRVHSVHTATKVCSASGGCGGNGCSRDERSSLYLKMHLGKTWRIRPFERGDTAAKHHVLCNTIHCEKTDTFMQTGLFLFVRN